MQLRQKQCPGIRYAKNNRYTGGTRRDDWRRGSRVLWIQYTRLIQRARYAGICGHAAWGNVGWYAGKLVVGQKWKIGILRVRVLWWELGQNLGRGLLPFFTFPKAKMVEHIIINRMLGFACACLHWTCYPRYPDCARIVREWQRKAIQRFINTAILPLLY